MDNQNTTTLPEKQFGFTHALALLLISVAVSFLLSPILLALKEIFYGFDKWMIFINYTVSFGVLFIIARMWWQVKHIDDKKVNIVIYLLIIPLVFSLSIISEAFASLIPMPESFIHLFEKMIQMNLQGFLTIVIIAPFLEELIFRGVILKRFLDKYSTNKAIVLSAVIFGIAHANPWQFIGAVLIGIAIGWVFVKTKSILPGMFMHFVNNFTGFVLAKKFSDVNITFKDIIGSTGYYISLLILCVLIIYAVYLVLNKYFNKKQQTIIE